MPHRLTKLNHLEWKELLWAKYLLTIEQHPHIQTHQGPILRILNILSSSVMYDF